MPWFCLPTACTTYGVIANKPLLPSEGRPGYSIDEFTRNLNRQSNELTMFVAAICLAAPPLAAQQWSWDPMLEVLNYLRASGYKTWIVTGGGQDFVRQASIPRRSTASRPSMIGSAGRTTYGYAKDGKPYLTKEPKLLLNDNNAGKPEGIHLMIGRRPVMAVGNSTGDQQMLEYTTAGDGARFRCWCCTTMPNASMPMVRRRACRTRKSARSHRSCTTRQRSTAGRSSA